MASYHIEIDTGSNATSSGRDLLDLIQRVNLDLFQWFEHREGMAKRLGDADRNNAANFAGIAAAYRILDDNGSPSNDRAKTLFDQLDSKYNTIGPLVAEIAAIIQK